MPQRMEGPVGEPGRLEDGGIVKPDLPASQGLAGLVGEGEVLVLPSWADSESLAQLFAAAGSQRLHDEAQHRHVADG